MARSVSNLSRCGNADCLDFVNTVHSRVADDAHDYLGGYRDLVRWARDGGLVGRREATGLQREAEADPALAEHVLQRALTLRELLHRLFAALASGADPAPGDVEQLNGWLAAVLGRRRIARAAGSHRWSWSGETDRLDRPLWPVVLSAAELLVEGDRSRIKECPAPDGCGWLFLDVSKNGARRWCEMRTCGTIAKARRHYRRHRRAGTS